MKPGLAVLLLFLAGACSLQGLTGGSPDAGTSVGGAGAGTGGAGGAGGASAFTWLRSVGNDSVQGTSPYASDTGSGSSLRVSDPGPDGDVWIAFATSGSIDPDGSGGAEAQGNTESFNLFLLHLGNGGTVLGFRALSGDFPGIEYALQVGAVVRLPGDALAVVGTLKGGSLEVGTVGTLAQTTATDDAFVLRLDADGLPTHARQLGGSNADVLRAGAVQGANLVVAGRFKGVLEVRDLAGAPDVACSYDEPTETYDRSLVAVLDAGTLECSRLVTFGATDPTAIQQPHAIAIDDSGVYVAGTFTRQIVAPPIPAVPSTSLEDGFVVALGPDLSMPEARWVARLTSNRVAADDGLRGLALWGRSVWVGGYQMRGTIAVMDREPSLGIVDGRADNDCALPLADVRDAVVGRLDRVTGACLGAVALGGAEEDEVRALVALDDGVMATGFTTVGIGGLDGSAAGGSRDGFFARFGSARGVTLEGGRAVGGLSWDYLDAARPVGDALFLAGSYGAPFDVLEGKDDFFVGKMPMPMP